MNKLKIILFAYLIIIYFPFFIPGSRVAGDFHYSYPEHLESLFDLPFLWSIRWGGGMGHYVSSLWAWPLELVFGFSGLMGINFSITERIAGPLLVVLTGYFGISKLLDFYKISPVGKLIGTAFFLTNTYLILLIDGGQINLAIAYSIIPIAFYLLKESIKNFKVKNLVLFTLSIFGISIVDLRIAVLLGFLIFLNLICDLFFNKNLSRSEILKRNVLLGIFSGFFLILFNAFWILPILFTKTTAFVPQNYLNLSQADFFSFSKISNGIFLQQPHWYQNDFGKISTINPDFLLIPLLVFLTPILLRRDLKVGFWVLSSLIFIFLSKGINPPFYQINLWLLNNIPLFVLFRDPTKFFFLIALSYSILISISIDEISKRLPDKKSLNILLPASILVYFLYLNIPVLTFKMTGMFSPPLFEDEFKSLNEEISKDQSFGRIVWIPVKSPLGYENPEKPAIDAYTLMEKRPFAVSNKGVYERLNFLREATYSGQLLDVLGVQSIIYPELDYRKDISDDQRQYYFTFLSQLKKLSYAKGLDENSKIPKLDLLNHQDRFFIPQNFWVVIGSDDIYKESTKSAQLNLSNNALVFAEEYAGLGEKIRNYPYAKILLNNKTPLDFAASLLDESELIFPAKYLRKDPDSSGWWKRDSPDLISWKEFLREKYGIDNQDFDFGGGWAVGEGEVSLEIKNPKLTGGKILLTRVMESTRSGKIYFYQDNQLLGSINTLKEGDNVRWFEIGSLKRDGEITMRSEGEINVVNALATITRNKWEKQKNQAEEMLAKQQIKSFTQASVKNPDVKVTYKKINPTKFEVDVVGLHSPKLLVFSDSYNNLWELNGQKSLPVYGIVNGFILERDGSYTVELSAQKYVYPGLLISVLSFLTLLALLVKTRHD